MNLGIQIPEIGGEQALGTVASGIVAEPVAGLAGIAQAVNHDARCARKYKPENDPTRKNDFHMYVTSNIKKSNSCVY